MSVAPRPDDASRPMKRPKLADIPGLTTAADVEPMWTLEDIARHLKVSRATVERLRAEGKLPPADWNPRRKLLRWKRSTITRWIEAGGRV